MEQIHRQQQNELSRSKEHDKNQKLVKLQSIKIRLEHVITLLEWVSGKESTSFFEGTEVSEKKLDIRSAPLRRYVLNELNDMKTDFGKVPFYELPNEETISILANIRATLSQAVLNTENIDTRLIDDSNSNTNTFIANAKFLTTKIQQEMDLLEVEISKIKYPPFDW